MNLEQEVASIISFAQHHAERVNSYYWDLPRDFKHPALFFPQPEITTGGETFRTYSSEYTWYIKVFAQTAQEAHEIGLALLTAIKRVRNCIPLIDQEGQETGGALRLKDPYLRPLEDGVEQLTIAWTSRRPYAAEEPLMVQSFKIGIGPKNE